MPRSKANRSSQRARGGRDVHAAGRDQTTVNAGDHAVIRIGDTGDAERGNPGNLPGRLLVGDVPGQPPGFQPRLELLAALDASGPGVSVVHAVTGMRGVGKTQLAAAYARAKLAAGWRLVAWVNAEDAASLAAGLAALAEAAGLDKDGGDPGLAVRHWLEAGGEQRLVVFDNATDPDLLRPYLPVEGAARVVVTSTRGSVAELGEPVGVGVFTPEEAAAFLADRTGLPDPAGAGELAGELGFLPLGLAQAAAVIRGQHLGYGRYLERLRTLPVADYLTRQDGQPYPHGVAETVLLSLQAVQAGDRAGACTGVLGLMCVLSAAGVRRDLLHAAGQAGVVVSGTNLDPAAVDEALGQLADTSLVVFTADDSVVAHRLVMRVARERLAAADGLPVVLDAAVHVLESMADEIGEAWRDPAGVREVAGQVSAATATATRYPDTVAEAAVPGLLRLRLRSVHLLNELGNGSSLAMAAAEPLVVDCERVLGADHRDTLMSRNEVAVAYVGAGRTAEAIPLHEQTLADLERVRGADDPDTLTSRHNLAIAYRDAGRFVEAIPLLERTVAGRQRVLGADHPDTLDSRNELALAYGNAGRIAVAIPLYERTLADRQRVLGADHPNTLRSRNNLALGYTHAGRIAEAIPLYERTLADLERVRGADHPDTLRSRNNLAMAYREAGRTGEAIPLLERTLADLERVRSADHPDTLTSRTNLAGAYQNAGRFAEAIPLLERTLADQERVIGADHPDFLNTWNNLAMAYRDAGRKAKAAPLFQRGLADAERLLGVDHPDTLTARNNLATAYQDAGRKAQAIALLERNLTDLVRVLGVDHPDTLTCRNNLAAAYTQVGQRTRALPMLERTLADCERVLGTDHPTTKLVRKNLARVRLKPQLRKRK